VDTSSNTGKQKWKFTTGNYVESEPAVVGMDAYSDDAGIKRTIAHSVRGPKYVAAPRRIGCAYRLATFSQAPSFDAAN